MSHICRDASTSLHALWILKQNDQEYKANMTHSKTIPKNKIKCKWNLIRLESRHLQCYFFLEGKYKVRTWTEIYFSAHSGCKKSLVSSNFRAQSSWMSWWVVPFLHSQTHQQWLATTLCFRMLIFLAAISLFWSSASLSNWFFYFLLPFLRVLMSLQGTSENSSLLLAD